MNWQNILGFDLDTPISEYGFSTRLENENSWTINFARDAIIEYKKFMYLAAISDSMVSPSEIVDVVWHQHLVFTQSYDEFCKLLGKKIAHIPSTHNRSDHHKFAQAKEYTQKIYKEHFGEQPAVYWEYLDIYGPLKMKQSLYWNTNTILLSGVFAFIPLVWMAYYLLRPVYVNISNPYFVPGYIILVYFVMRMQNRYNDAQFRALRATWDPKAFMLNLSPLELVYLKDYSILKVIHGIVNKLVKENRIDIAKGQVLTVTDRGNITNPQELCILETIEESGKLVYSSLLRKLVEKPLFHKTVRALDGYKKYISRSFFLIRLFAINVSTFMILLLLGITRIVTGVIRDKPVVFITLVVICTVIAIASSLLYLIKALESAQIVQVHKDNRPAKTDWDWEYFILGPAVFAPVFIPLVNHPHNSSTGGDSGGGSSCSSGCGSSCGGGGCGGCGGD